MGAHECLVSAVMRADMDLRRTLFSQIVLSGGSTCTPGFGDRLLNEVSAAINAWGHLCCLMYESRRLMCSLCSAVGYAFFTNALLQVHDCILTFTATSYVTSVGV
jgi:actin-related protein